jgi:hypothetical protein
MASCLAASLPPSPPQPSVPLSFEFPSLSHFALALFQEQEQDYSLMQQLLLLLMQQLILLFMQQQQQLLLLLMQQLLPLLMQRLLLLLMQRLLLLLLLPGFCQSPERCRCKRSFV